MRALSAFELTLVLGHRRCRSPFLLLAEVVLLRHLRRLEDVLLFLIHSRTLDDHSSHTRGVADSIPARVHRARQAKPPRFPGLSSAWTSPLSLRWNPPDSGIDWRATGGDGDGVRGSKPASEKRTTHQSKCRSLSHVSSERWAKCHLRTSLRSSRKRTQHGSGQPRPPTQTTAGVGSFAASR
jgi:hypothetical protein